MLMVKFKTLQQKKHKLYITFPIDKFQDLPLFKSILPFLLKRKDICNNKDNSVIYLEI